MAGQWDDILDDLQTDAYQRLLNEPFFEDIIILLQRKGVTQSDVETALTVFNEQSGKKAGACVIVMMPEVGSDANASRRPDSVAILRVECITIPIINDDETQGTTKQASKIALNVRESLHLYFSGLTRCTLHQSATPIVPPNDPNDGEVTMIVTMEASFATGRAYKCATPAASAELSALTITCATSGASIYYTTDGSYPGAENAEASIYTTPLAITDSMIIRAVAYKTGYAPSNSTYWKTGFTVLGDGEGNALGDGEGAALGTGEVGINTPD